MRFKLFTLCVLCFILFATGWTYAETMSFSLETNPGNLRITGEIGKIFIAIDGYKGTEYLNYPSIPYRVVSVLIPQGEEVSDFRLEVHESLLVDSSVKLSSFNGKLRDDGELAGLLEWGDRIVSEGGEFPKWKVRLIGTGWLKGYRVASFAIYPVRYNVNTGRLAIYTNYHLVVNTKAEFPLTGAIERLRHIDGFREEARREVESLVINPGVVETYTFNEIEVDPGNRGFLPSFAPSMEGSEVKYLIVTNSEMEPAFQRLAEWKTRKGIPAVVRTIEWIEQNYRGGADKAESIRNFLQEAYAKWGVEWVLLGGDTDIIPARYAYVTFYTGEVIPTDMYYSCLDGTWNADADSIWGEAYHGQDDPGDDADMYSEVYLGRFPVSNYSEASILVDKVIRYKTPLDTLSKRKFLMLAEVIFPPDYNPGDNIILDGAEIAQHIYEYNLEGYPDVTVTRMYETYDLYPGSQPLTKHETIDSMNVGVNHVVHVGHGYKYNMSVGDGSILNYDASTLVNGDALFAMYLMSCTNVAFDTDCLAEYFLLNPEGGAFSVTGSSRSAFPSASRPYMDRYFELIYHHDIVQLGRLHVMSREPFTESAFGESADRWTHFIYNLLGDPELCLFQGRARTLDVTHPSTATFGSNTIAIQVTSEGVPFDSAFVCLYKEGDDYQYEKTDASGNIVFSDFMCKSEGYIYLTVTGLNACRYQDSIYVSPESSAYLKVSGKKVIDDSGGNGDGILDAGEIVGLQIELTNTGQSYAGKLYAVLTSLDTSVTVIDSVVVYPDLSNKARAYSIDTLLIQVSSDIPDEKPVEFLIHIYDSTGGNWVDRFAMEVHAPVLELYVNKLSDSAPYGDGDGIIEPGEYFLLQIGVKNFGSGTAYGLQGKISSADTNITIVDSVSNYSDISLLDIQYGDGFVLSEADISSANYFTFELTDVYGRKITKVLELRKPGPPVGIVLDASSGPTEMLITWHRPDSLEHYRYQVYRSLQQQGPYELVNRDLVYHELFADYGLEPSTRYYYILTTVDSCGNESDPSAEITGTTNPPQLAGWPNHVGKETASSVKIGDIDGDTHPEIVVGAEYVYAWHSNGIEVRDGDGQPLTWGILNTEGDNFTATVALADLDGLPGSEIVAASWNTKEIYIFDHDGNTLPGWPQSTKYLCWASPVVGDFDGDSELEIIAYDVGGRVYVWNVDGTELMDGDSDPNTNGMFFQAGPTSIWHISTPALADIDEDGIQELIVCAPDDSIYCLNSDGSYVPGWPVYIQDAGASISASPAVGDIDGDGHLEVVVQNTYARVMGLNHDGTTMAGWPKWVYSNSSFNPSPALADLTGDGKLEVVIASVNGSIYIFRYDGSSLPNWPQTYASEGGTESSPVIADVDGDGSLDIILGCEEGLLNAWNINGEYIAGFPINVRSFLRGTPVVYDLDYDGDLELATSCWNQNIYVWDLSGKYSYGCMQWNGFHGNNYNNGWKEFKDVTAVEQLTYTAKVSGRSIELMWNVVPDVNSWNLYRSKESEPFELIEAELHPDNADVITYTDRSVEEGLKYRYKLVSESQEDYIIETEELEVPVAHVRLYQNHPNPFNPSTRISFTIPGGSSAHQYVRLAVYDVTGRLVKTLVNEVLPGGRYEVSWDGRNEHGEQVASGIYFANLTSKGVRITRKMVLLR